MISDLDVWRSAMVMVKRYGDGAMLDQVEVILRQQASLSTEHLLWMAVVVNLLGLAS